MTLNTQISLCESIGATSVLYGRIGNAHRRIAGKATMNHAPAAPASRHFSLSGREASTSGSEDRPVEWHAAAISQPASSTRSHPDEPNRLGALFDVEIGSLLNGERRREEAAHEAHRDQADGHVHHRRAAV